MNQETRGGITKGVDGMYTNFPCLSCGPFPTQEKKLVDECFNRTGYEKEACVIPITNYKACKSFWGAVEKVRKKENVKPFRPDGEERARIKAYFLEHKKLPKFPMEPAPS